MIVRFMLQLMKIQLDNIQLHLRRKKNGILMKLKHFVRHQLLKIFLINKINHCKILTSSIIVTVCFFFRALTNNVDRLLQILELQLQIDMKYCSWNDYLLKNVIIIGRSGSGKKTVVGECCQRLWNKYLIYYKFIDCLSFKG